MHLIDALKVLEISFEADVHAVKQAYRRLAMQMHPDIAPLNDSNGIITLNQAYKLAVAWAANAPCPHCEKGKVTLVRGLSVLKIPCTFCKGTGKRG